MGETRKKDAPGLKWRIRAGGKRVPYWVAKDPGYPVRTVALGHLTPLAAEAMCRELEAEMLAFMGDRSTVQSCLDGTIGGLIREYCTHPESPYRTLKPSSLLPYRSYAKTLERTLGAVRLAGCSGLDVKRWFDTWRAPKGSGHKETLAAAAMTLSVLKAALRFGVFSGGGPRRDECRVLLETIREGRFEKPAHRTAAPTAADVDGLRAAAHEVGLHSVALATAFQFECSLRQWDVIGQWAGKFWAGLSWSDVDAAMILSLTPTKTAKTTGASVKVDLSLCPMVLEEIGRVPAAARNGPVVVSEGTGRPYTPELYRATFRRCANAAGWPATTWSRDIRAGGITEGSAGGAMIGDLAKQAGHASDRTTKAVYDRDTLEANRRVNEKRTAFRVVNNKS